MRRYICPYENDDREMLTVRTIEVPKIILTCDTVCDDVMPGGYVSRGSLIGYKEETPVYASIDGLVARIGERKENCRKRVYDITVRRCSQEKMPQAEVPFYAQAGGSYFLQQLGIAGCKVNRAKIICVNAVEAEPYASSAVRLIAEAPAKVVLGAAVLARCMDTEKIVFYIERSFGAADYLLNKYIKKYRVLLRGIDFEVEYLPRRYPMCFSEKVVFDIQTALWAYDGFYEHVPATDVCAAVSVFVGDGVRRLQRSEILRFPVGAVVEDVAASVGVKKESVCGHRFVLGGPMSGRSGAPWHGIGALVRQLCIFDEAAAEIFSADVSACIGCHLCERICPVKVTPYLLNSSTLSKCIGCHLCSYVCPAKIALSERIGRNKQRGKTTGRRVVRRPSRYIELPGDADIPAAVQKSDAPPHIHSGNSVIGFYGRRIGAASAAAIVKAAAVGAPAAGQILFSAFFFMAFHEILSGFFSSFFRKSHWLKGIADGLLLGLVLTPAMSYASVLTVSFLCVTAEKWIWRYQVRFSAPLAAALLLFSAVYFF